MKSHIPIEPICKNVILGAKLLKYYLLQLPIVIAYDMYLEATEGQLDYMLKMEISMTFSELRKWLSDLMCKYKPTYRLVHVTRV
eukprot:7732527-Ditylum_brightwellii.AAC.1